MMRPGFYMICALVTLTASCSLGGGSGLPPGYNEKSTRTFDIDLDEEKALVRPFAGLDGGVSPTSALDSGFALLYQQHGVGRVRIPRGSRCTITLDKVCPDPAGSVEEDPVCAFGFEALDRAMRDLVKLGIEPVWQAMFDIGAGACEVKDGIGTAVRTVSDPEIWPVVVSRVLAHLRAIGLFPSYVEFLPDAMGTGGYSEGQVYQVLNLYDAFISRLRDDFPGKEGEDRPFDVVAPSFPITYGSGPDDGDSPMDAFLDHLSGQSHKTPDVISMMSVSGTLEERLSIWEALRKRLDESGMSDSGLADVGPRLTEAVWEGLSDVLHSKRERSAFLAAHLAAAKILAQDVLDMMSADRWSGPRATDDSQAGEDLFMEDDGSALPALTSMLPFYLMESAGAVRVKTVLRGTSEPSDNNGFAAMTAVSASGARVHVVIAAADQSMVGKRMAYQLEFSGMPVWANSGELSLAVVSSNTGAFGFGGSVTVALDDGKLFVTREIDVPSVHCLSIELSAVEPAPVKADVMGDGG